MNERELAEIEIWKGVLNTLKIMNDTILDINIKVGEIQHTLENGGG